MSQDGDITHGTDGWVLVEYDWDEDSGESWSLYERYVYGALHTRELYRQQRAYWTPLEDRYDRERHRDRQLMQ